MTVRRISVAIFLLLIALVLPASAQVVCPTGFPSESPVLSFSPDDIPATNIDIITYTGAIVKPKANHSIAFVELSPDEHFTRAQALLDSKRSEDALRELEHVKPGPKERAARLFHLRGEALFRSRHQYEEASKAFAQAATHLALDQGGTGQQAEPQPDFIPVVLGEFDSLGL